MSALVGRCPKCACPDSYRPKGSARWICARCGVKATGEWAPAGAEWSPAVRVLEPGVETFDALFASQRGAERMSAPARNSRRSA